MEPLTFFTGVACIIAAILYMSPTIWAYKTKHPHWIPILLLNLCLGWTIWAWVVALIWACVSIDNISEKDE